MNRNADFVISPRNPISRTRRKHSIASVTAAANDKQVKRDAKLALRNAAHQQRHSDRRDCAPCEECDV